MRTNPKRKHLPWATAKENRQYEHIVQSLLDRNATLETAKRIAAATVRARRKNQAQQKKSLLYRVGGKIQKLGMKKWKVSARDLSRCRRKVVRERAETDSDAISAARSRLGSGYDDFKVMNPYKKTICVRNPSTGSMKYYDLVILKQAAYVPGKGWKYGSHTYRKRKGTQKLSGANYLDLSTGYVYTKKERNRPRSMRNVQMGFWDQTGFHPIRASYDYDPDRLEEPELYQYKTGVRRAKRKAAKRATKKAAARKPVRKRAAKKTASRVVRSSRKSATSRKAASTARKAIRGRGRRHNVQMGFWDQTGFHPIRASYDYDPDRLFEPELYQYKTGVRRAKRKAAKRATKKAAARKPVRKRAAKKTASRIVRSTRKSAARRAGARRHNPMRRGMRKEYARAKKLPKTPKSKWALSRSEYRKFGMRHRRTTRRYYKNQASPEEIRRDFAGSVHGARDLWFPKGTPEGLAKLGKLVSITTEDGIIKPVAGTAWLCADTHGQLHLGSTSGAPLYDGPERDFGEVSKIEYEDVKRHLGYSKPIIWFHHVGERNGIRPTLWADGEGGLVFEGGDYHITSRGLEN